MRDHRQQLGPSAVEGGQRLELFLGLGLQATLLDYAAEQRPDRHQKLDLFGCEGPRLDGLDVDHADDRVVPRQRHREHRHELRLVEAGHPFEARVHTNVRRCDRPADQGSATGQALAHGQRDRADLIAVQAVRGGQPQLRRVTLHQVHGADLDVQSVGGAVDDRSHQFVPVAGRGQQLGELMQERELAQLTLGVRRGRGTAPEAGTVRWALRLERNRAAAARRRPARRL